jgi:hypothetical protein
MAVEGEEPFDMTRLGVPSWRSSTLGPLAFGTSWWGRTTSRCPR